MIAAMTRALGITLLALAACATSSGARRVVVDAHGRDTREEAPRETTTPAEPTPALPRLESAHAIADASTWSRLAARPATSSIARTEVVKFIVDRADARRIWFIDTERYEIHFFFARDRLSRPGLAVEDHETFNVREYRRDDRRFEMGSIVHYLDSDLYTFELIGGDTLSGDRIVALFEEIRGALYFGERLRFRAISEQHERSIAAVRDRLPLATSEEVFAGVRYQPLTQGLALGTLRIVRGALDPASARPDEILVLEHLPDEIPVVAGVVSAELQAPLGHIAILCANRGTPNMGLRGALEHAELARLDGQLVALGVGTQDFTLRAATREEAEAAWAARRPAQPLIPRLDASRRELRDVCQLGMGDAAFAGAKAAQLGEACQLGPPVITPGGFVVPVAHYLSHLTSHGLDAGVAGLLADATFRGDQRARHQRLAELRVAIEQSAVDRVLVADMRRRMQRLAPRSRFILRSSTNAEDLAGFNGAGLYRSIVVPAGASEDEIARALREVWASVWLAGAYEEREWYRVDHQRVGMAVLVQPFVDGAFANGVAITANPFYQARPGYFVNAQVLGGSVTGAGGDEVPEQHLIYTYSEVIESELVSRSSRSPGAALLDEPAILRLTEILTLLHAHFVPRWGATANAVDVEFLLAGDDRHVVILQARPYFVSYSEEQRWR